MNRIPISQIVLVEGKYDKIALENLIDGTIIACDGFQIYHDQEKKQAIRALAMERGAIILTDADSAGAQLRSFLQTILQGAQVYTLYTPAVEGKERRKTAPSKEGYLGVEGFDAQTLYGLFSEFRAEPIPAHIQAQTLFSYGLTGRPGAKERKEALLRALSLPPHLSNKALLRELNRRFTEETLEELIKKLPQD